MSQVEKLASRLKSEPRDFTWDELVRLLKGLGYRVSSKGMTGESRRRFVHDELGSICLHEPHPSKVLKMYVIKEIIKELGDLI